MPRWRCPNVRARIDWVTDRAAIRGTGPEGPPADLYKEVADLARRNLDDQLSQLDSIRNRAVQFLAFVGSATGFLVGTTLSGAERGLWFGILGGLASVVFVLLLLMLRSILNGTHGWYGFGSPMNWYEQQDATAYLEWLDGDTQVTAVKFHRSLARKYREHQVENARYLRVLQRRFTAFLLTGGGLLASWVALAWRYGQSAGVS